jgi:hypothetical protein
MRDERRNDLADRAQERYLAALRERVAWQAEAAARARSGRTSSALPPETPGAAASLPGDDWDDAA